MKKHFYYLGILASIFYLIGVIVGGFLIPHYSHISQFISEIDSLISSDKRIITTIIFGAYNVLCALYGLFYYLNNRGKRLEVVQGICVFIIGLCGFLMLFFPMDIIGEAVTLRGIIHIVLAGIIAPLTILCTTIGFWAFKSDKSMRTYSLVTGIVIFISGGLTSLLTASSFKAIGILERITIGSYIIWLTVTALYQKKIITKKI